MSRFLKLLAVAALAAGVMASAPQAAQAQHHHGGGHWHGGGGHWHGGGWRGGWGGWGPGFAFGWGYGPYYGGPYYYGAPAYGPDCGWVRQRYISRGHWHVRRVWRCW